MTYSQNSEDVLVHHYFGDHKGRLLEIGANDGKTFSNSLMLIELGWEAVLVEPSPTCANKIIELHKGNGAVTLAELAIGDTTGEFELHESGAIISDDYSLVSTLIPAEKKRWEPLKTKWKSVKVDCFTWADFYSMYPGKYDFVSIDCEGFDLKILQQMNLDEMGVRCLCVEFNGKDKELFLEAAPGFRLLEENGENLILVR